MALGDPHAGEESLAVAIGWSCVEIACGHPNAQLQFLIHSPSRRQFACAMIASSYPLYAINAARTCFFESATLLQTRPESKRMREYRAVVGPSEKGVLSTLRLVSIVTPILAACNTLNRHTLNRIETRRCHLTSVSMWIQ